MSSSIEGWAEAPLEISLIRVNGQNLELNRTYRVVSHDYIISQWDKYLGFVPKNAWDSGDLFLDAIINQVELQLSD